MEVSSAGASASHLASGFANVRTSVLAEAATTLGISVDQLRAEVAAGKPLSDIAALAGISMQQPAVTLGESDRPGTVDVRI